jgi:hypothetical protein
MSRVQPPLKQEAPSSRLAHILWGLTGLSHWRSQIVLLVREALVAPGGQGLGGMQSLETAWICPGPEHTCGHRQPDNLTFSMIGRAGDV